MSLSATRCEYFRRLLHIELQAKKNLRKNAGWCNAVHQLTLIPPINTSGILNVARGAGRQPANNRNSLRQSVSKDSYSHAPETPCRVTITLFSVTTPAFVIATIFPGLNRPRFSATLLGV